MVRVRLVKSEESVGFSIAHNVRNVEFGFKLEVHFEVLSVLSNLAQVPEVDILEADLSFWEYHKGILGVGCRNCAAVPILVSLRIYSFR